MHNSANATADHATAASSSSCGAASISTSSYHDDNQGQHASVSLANYLQCSPIDDAWTVYASGERVLEERMKKVQDALALFEDK